MSSISPTILSTTSRADTHLLSTTAPDQTYLRIFQVSVLFILAAPLLVGIYESWRKKLVSNIHLQDFSKSLNPFTLYKIGLQELTSSHWSSSLERMSPSEASKMQFDKLSQYQRSLLASRAHVVNELNSDQLSYLYLNITTPKKEFVASLSNGNLLALLNCGSFNPDEEFGTFDLGKILPAEARQIPLKKLSKLQLNFLAKRADVVNELNSDQLSYLYLNITTPKKEFVASLSNGNLLALLNCGSFNPDEEFGTFDLGLGTMPFSEAELVPIEKLSYSQLTLLASRVDFVKELKPNQLLDLYLNKNLNKEEFINGLPTAKVRDLLNHSAFNPGEFTATFESILERRDIFRLHPSKLRTMNPSEVSKIPKDQFERLTRYQLNILAMQAEVVNRLNPDQLLYLYQKATLVEEEFEASLSGRQLLALLTHRSFLPAPAFYDRVASRADFIDELNPHQLLYLYQNIPTRKKEFVTELRSRQLLALLSHQKLNGDDKFAIFEMTLPRQIDHVDIFAILCATYSVHLCVLFFAMKKKASSLFFRPRLDLLENFISNAKAKIASLPTSQTKVFLSELPLNQFTLLFFPADQLSCINFKLVQFTKIECVGSGTAYQINLNETTPRMWLESVCTLFDYTLVQKPWPSFSSPLFDLTAQIAEAQQQVLGSAVQIAEAKQQLQRLSTKQAAFLYRRTEGMQCQDKVFRNVFDNQLEDIDFSTYKREFDEPNTVISSQVQKLSISEAYEILDLKNGSSWDEIKAKYRKLALLHHPDKAADKEQSTVIFQKLKEAYELFGKLNQT